MKGKTSSPPSGKAPMSDADFRALPILTWVPDPNNPGFSLYRSDRKFYYASSIPDDKLAAAPALLHAHEGIGVPGKEPIAFLARPEDPELRAKWVVCVFRLPDSHQEPLRTEEQSYFAGMVDGMLVAGMRVGGRGDAASRFAEVLRALKETVRLHDTPQPPCACARHRKEMRALIRRLEKEETTR